MKIINLGNNGIQIFGFNGRGIAPGTVFGQTIAEYLLTNNLNALPLPLLPTYKENFNHIKEIYYELGATLTHALSSFKFINNS